VVIVEDLSMKPRKKTVPLFKLGDRVQLKHSNSVGRVVELNGALGPKGCQVYTVRVRRWPKAMNTVAREDQLILLKPKVLTDEQRALNDEMFNAVKTWAAKAKGKHIQKLRIEFAEGGEVSKSFPVADLPPLEPVPTPSFRVTSPECWAVVLPILRETDWIEPNELIARMNENGSTWDEATVKRALLEMVTIGVLDQQPKGTAVRFRTLTESPCG